MITTSRRSRRKYSRWSTSDRVNLTFLVLYIAFWVTVGIWEIAEFGLWKKLTDLGRVLPLLTILACGVLLVAQWAFRDRSDLPLTDPELDPDTIDPNRRPCPDCKYDLALNQLICPECGYSFIPRKYRHSESRQ